MTNNGTKTTSTPDQIKQLIKHYLFQQLTQLLTDHLPTPQGGMGVARISMAPTRFVTATSDTITPDDFLVSVNAGASAATETLPSASDGGRLLIIINQGATTLVAPAGSDTINGSASSVGMVGAGEFSFLFSDGISDWNTISRGTSTQLPVMGPSSSTVGAIASYGDNSGKILINGRWILEIGGSGDIYPLGNGTQSIGNPLINEVLNIYLRAVFNNQPPTTVNGSIGGTIVWTQPDQGSAYKKVIIQFNAFHDAGTIVTFTKAFSSVPVITGNTSGLSISTLTAMAITIPVSTAATGFITIEGF